MSLLWLNGNFIEESAASIPLRDTGLLHGAGVFTTMRSYGGKVFRLQRHLARLRDSCGAFSIPLKYADEQLVAAVAQLLERNQLDDARLRLTATRGSPAADQRDAGALEPNVFLTAAALEAYPAELYQRGLTAVLVDEQKLNPYDITAGHKTLNYLPRLAALREANRRGAGEALWFDVHHYLQSGCISNIFIAKDGALMTPPTLQELRDEVDPAAIPYRKSSVLPGMTRQAVIELAQQAGIEVRLSAIDIHLLLDADEVFLTNSIMQIMPVCRIERKPVGAERPGEVVRRLSELFEQVVRRETHNA